MKKFFKRWYWFKSWYWRSLLDYWMYRLTESRWYAFKTASWTYQPTKGESFRLGQGIYVCRLRVGDTIFASTWRLHG